MAKSDLHQSGSKLLPLFLLFTLLALQMPLSFQLATTRLALPEPPKEAIRKPEADLFRFFSFGHLASAVDSLTLRFTLDPSIGKIRAGERSATFFDLDLATDLDPAYFSLYFHGSNFLAVVNDDKQSALELLHKGERYRKNELPKTTGGFTQRYWETAWTLPVTLAYIYLFEFDDIENAAYAFIEASRIEGSPPYLISLAERLKTRSGIYDVGIRLLNFMALGAQEENTKAAIEEKRKHLYLNQYLYQVNEAFRAYLLTRTKGDALTETLKRVTIERYWKSFTKDYQVLDRDIFGGKIFLDSSGKAQTTTERRKVLGLE